LAKTNPGVYEQTANKVVTELIGISHPLSKVA
jgi:hypothetical protein